MKGLPRSARWVLGTGLSLTLLFSAFAGFMIAQMKATVRKSLAIQQYGQVRAVARQIDQGLALRFEAIRGIGEELRGMPSLSPSQASEFLTRYRSFNALFSHSTRILTPDGRILGEATQEKPGRDGVDPSYDDYLHKVKQAGTNILPAPLLLVDRELPILAFWVPVRGGSGAVRAHLVGRIDIRRDALFHLVASNSIGSNGYFYIVDGEGRFLFHPDGNRLRKPIPARGVNAMLDRAQSGANGAGETVNSRGQAQFLAFHALGQAPWILFGAYPLEEAYASVALIRNALLAAIATILLLTLLTFAVIGWRLRYGERRVASLEETNQIHLETLRQAELMGNMGTYMVGQKRDGRPQPDYLSPGLLKILGFDGAERIREETMGSLFDAAALEKLQRGSSRVMETGETERMELDARRADGAVCRLSFLFWRAGSGPQAVLMGLVHDLTETQRSQNLLEEYRMLFHLAVDAFAILRPDGVLEQVNPALAAFLGRTPEQVKGRSLLESLEPEDREVARRCLAEAAAQGTFVTDLRIRLKSRGGEVRRLSLNLAPDLAAGKIYAVARDMTALEDSISRVARQARFLDAMEPTARLGLWELEHQAGRFHASDGLKRLFGFNRHSSFERDDFLARLNPPARERMGSVLAHGAGPDGEEMEGAATTLDGRALWLRFFLRSDRGGAGPALTLCVIQENTALRRSREFTEESETRFRELFTHLSAGFALHALHYHPDGRPSDYRYLLVNPSFERMVGMGAAQLLGSSARELFPEDGRSLLEGYAGVVRTGKPLSFVHFEKSTKRYFRVDAFRTREGQFATLFYDISDQIREENAHRRAQQRLSILLHSIHAVVYEADPDHQVRWISMQAQRLFGHPLSAWLAPGFWAGQIDPEDRERALADSARGIATRLPFSLEHRFRCADGRTIWIRQMVTPVFEDGRLEGLRGVMIDVTETKRIALLNREHEARMKAILDSMGEGLVYLDPRGRILECNRVVEEFLGLGREEILARPSKDPAWEIQGVDGNPLAPEENPFLTTLQKGTSRVDQRLCILFRDGRRRWLSVNSVPILGATGQIEAGLFTFRDISDRMKSEEEMRDLEARTSDYLQLVQVLIIALDREGRILMANRRAEELLGMPSEKLIGLDWHEHFVPAASRVALRRLHESVIEGRIALFSSYEGDVIKADGSIANISWRLTLFRDREGRATSTVSAGVDVTDERAMEETRAKLTRTLEREVEARKGSILRARQLQGRLNRHPLPLLPMLDLHAAYLPAEEVSGDFLRVFVLSGGRLAIVLADCTGHGVEASMMSVMLHTLCESYVPTLDGTGDPAAYLARLNKRLCELNMEDQFPVMTVAVLHSVSGKVVWAHANGEPMAILGPGGVTLLPRARGMHLGFDPETTYANATATLKEGETLLVYSDALAELVEKPGTPVLAALLHQTTVAIVKSLLEACAACHGGKVVDDLTLVACRRMEAWERTLKPGERPQRDAMDEAMRLRGWADDEIISFLGGIDGNGDRVDSNPLVLHIDCVHARAECRGLPEDAALPPGWVRGNSPKVTVYQVDRRAPQIEDVYRESLL
ncbi:MAG: PAS domain S-box protein [Spirochaetes bacterium]|nr:PAS domain S-box protein [Spirochaetota bacterium]